MLSSDSRCKTLDASADGYVRGEACLVLLVGSTSAGESHAVVTTTRVAIPGSAINQDGRSSSLTAPNGPSQQSVMRA
eukprot:2378993-Pyramimonas_sp.AAC.1